MNFVKAFRAELLKLRHSKVTWLSALAYVFIALMAAFVLWIVKNPQSARDLGLIGQKANFLAEGITADWRGLFSFMAEMSMMGGIIIFAFIVIYIFGREYAEGTAKNMLALPMRRANFVAAKLAVASLWYAALTAFLIAQAFAVGGLLGMGVPPMAEAARACGDILFSALLVVSLQPLVALVTVGSGGYLAPFGYTIGTLLIGNLMIRTDWARWCPWSIVALLSGMTGPRQPGVVPGSLAVLALTFVLGVAATALYLERADNCQ